MARPTKTPGDRARVKVHDLDNGLSAAGAKGPAWRLSLAREQNRLESKMHQSAYPQDTHRALTSQLSPSRVDAKLAALREWRRGLGAAAAAAAAAATACRGHPQWQYGVSLVRIAPGPYKSTSSSNLFTKNIVPRDSAHRPEVTVYPALTPPGKRC